jgi:hypothetical protein
VGMHENQTVRELLEAALRKLDDVREDPSYGESNTSSETSSTHPGLERFTMIEKSTDAPKPCFMEPGRSCVKSGACEMRGY